MEREINTKHKLDRTLWQGYDINHKKHQIFLPYFFIVFCQLNRLGIIPMIIFHGLYLLHNDIFGLLLLLVFRTVSWVRYRDIHLLTHGVQSYTDDKRFSAYMDIDTNTWQLRIKNVSSR